MSSAPSIIPVLFGTRIAQDTPEPWYVDAFLDRGKSGKEPRLHLLSHRHHISMQAVRGTVGRPGSLAWPGFIDRPSSQVLAAKIALGRWPTAKQYPYTYQAQRFLTYIITPPDHAWGREHADVRLHTTHWWASSCYFHLGNATTLPMVREVLAQPGPIKNGAWPVAGIQAQHSALPVALQKEARILPVLAFELGGDESSHLQLAVYNDVRIAVGAALQSIHRLRSFGEDEGLPLIQVTTPVWAGPCAPE